eukprot:7128988-Pyramimonas_sp.AAC.1
MESQASSSSSPLTPFPPDPDEDDDDVELLEEDALAFLNAIESQDLDEDEVVEVFGAVLEEKFGKEKRRTWMGSRRLKLAKRTDRDFFERRRNQRPSRPGFKRVGDQDLRKKSRCANCGER